MPSYATVTARFTDPAGTPLAGAVSFTPEADAVLLDEAGYEPAIVLPDPVTAALDATGRLAVSLLAPEDGVTNPVGWTWRVIPALVRNGYPVRYQPWSLAVTPDEVVDLARAAPVPSTSGTPVTRGYGVSSAVVDDTGALVLTLEDGTDLAPVPLPEGPPGPQGRGITSVADPDLDGTATVTYTDGTTEALPLPPGPEADLTGYATTTDLTTGLATKVNTTDAVLSVNGTVPDDAGNVVVTGATSAYELRGIGSPEGVVTADPGYYYTDTAGTNGAWRWVKTSGTAATGWQVLLGDTGWRDITSSATGISSGAFRIRRIGPTVFLVGRGTLIVSGYGAVLLTLPEGFRTGLSTMDSDQFWWQDYSTFKTAEVNSSGEYRLANAPTLNSVASVRTSFPATQPWPAVLPGTPL